MPLPCFERDKKPLCLGAILVRIVFIRIRFFDYIALIIVCHDKYFAYKLVARHIRPYRKVYTVNKL
jgi:hypothetical protein